MSRALAISEEREEEGDDCNKQKQSYVNPIAGKEILPKEEKE